ncbi:ArsR family transcriptional regulator [Mycobacterium sp. Root135]|uniref:ArsR/SmtB family transcription factor n=1 Tax=Mycobacterium sp. Root135 TaxID=1736457 RepID=UPI0006FC2C31|nr:helix-turn-helix transcriptional regulator [Mycobacterium sp. Root135]KQY07609.1 ArsR family transcriptional regulator [Mycobacterium sp. Root135]
MKARPQSATASASEVDPGALQDVLQALADPVRRSIIRQLAESSAPISCGSFDLWVAKSTLTYHFNMLRSAGIIHQFEQGTSKMNLLRKDDVDAAYPGLLDSVLAATASESHS